ncbi:MAG TPA: helix-turn-helix domain-containing protein [Hymenobacter sp.]
MVERIRQLLETKQLTPTQFADAIGVARPIVSHILSGRNKPSLEVVQKIIAAFPDLALPWLLNGVGEMLARPTPAIPSASAGPRTQTPERAAGSASGKRRDNQGAEMDARAAKEPVAPLFAEAIHQPAPVETAPAPVVSAQAADPSSMATSQPRVVTPIVPDLVAPLPLAPEANQQSVAQKATPTPVPSAALAFAEPDKAIRRIVIFYQDGTFTDYRPEAV